ncbi:hypothetical protein C6A85_98915 [Mycobacterium sp. ITM-2017-0098]|nr:hypothetical protein C6A85_98915 [Mycobacterium sp. ITM-2017-0098]
MPDVGKAIDLPLVRRAADGDREALAAVLTAVKDNVYRLSVRMLWHPADAEDATQEILIKVMTRLDSFRGHAAFETWTYRLAVNHLLTTRARRAERTVVNFDEMSTELATGLDLPHLAPGVDENLLAEEVKVGCTQAMLLCLDRPHRAAYILGEILELNSPEAADILDVTPAAYRKRLSRARSRIQDFMRVHCGLIEPANGCRCARRVGCAIGHGRTTPDQLLFTDRVRTRVHQIEGLRDAAAVFRSHPELRASDHVVTAILATGFGADFDSAVCEPSG